MIYMKIKLNLKKFLQRAGLFISIQKNLADNLRNQIRVEKEIMYEMNEDKRKKCSINRNERYCTFEA